MQAYDFIVLIVLIIATIWGARRGFATQLATLLSLALGYIVAINFRGQVAPMIDAPPPWNQFAAMLGLFMATSFLVWTVFRFLKGTIEKMGLSGFDTQLGGLLGLIKGGVIAMAITMFSVVMLGETQRDAVLGSYSGYNICRVINKAQRFVPSEWQETMQPYLETVVDHPNFAGEPVPQAVPTSPSDWQNETSTYEEPNFATLPTSTEGSPTPTQVDGNSTGWGNSQARLRAPVFDR